MKLTAKKYSVRLKDLAKGLLMAVGTAAGTEIQKVMDIAKNGTPMIYPAWKIVAMAAIAAALTYIVRKFFVDDVKIAEQTIEKANENEK